MNKIKIIQKQYSINPSEWLTTPISDIKVSYKTTPREQKTKINTSKDIYNFLNPIWPDIEYYESFYIMYLNRANIIQGCKLISMGSITGTLVDVRLALQPGILLGSSSMVLAHNHPSGQLNPSDTDKKLTEKIKNAAIFQDMIVLDHIILTKDSYYSFADEGLV